MQINTSENFSQTPPRRILSSLLSSLSAGVVPRAGAPYIAIGRNAELRALAGDLDNIADGGAALRFLIGKYGSGKSFLIQLIRTTANERGFITADCDLSPDRHLCGGDGKGIATYRELIKNMASRACPDGGALPKIIAKWTADIGMDIAASGISPESPEFIDEQNKAIFATLKKFEFGVGGFDFANVLAKYCEAVRLDNSERASACLRWLRGEYETKTQAKSEMGFAVGSVISDSSWFDYVKLWAAFAKEAGYNGLVIFIDECVNLFKITNRISRENNYEKLLSIFNDTLSGRAANLGVIFGGTPQFLEDTRRGLFGYEALRSRLADTRFSSGEFENLNNPVLRLRRLSEDELYALCVRLKILHDDYYGGVEITNEEIAEFLNLCFSRVGASETLTPREIIRDFLGVLDIMTQNAGAKFEDIIKASGVNQSRPKTEEEKKNFSPDDIKF